MKEVADEIFEALFQIPIILSGAQRVLVIYKDSKKLRACSSALYTSILHGLGYVLSYLREKSISRSIRDSVKALVQLSSYRLDIDEKIKNITKSREAFNAEADICQKEMVKKMRDMTETGRDAAQDVQRKMNAMAKALETASLEKQRTSKEISDSLKTIEESTSELKLEMAATKKVMFEIKHLLMASPKALEEAYINCEYSCRQHLNHFLTSLAGRRLDAPEPNNYMMQMVMLPTKQSSRDISPNPSKKSKEKGRKLYLSLSYEEQTKTNNPHRILEAGAASNNPLTITLRRKEIKGRCLCQPRHCSNLIPRRPTTLHKSDTIISSIIMGQQHRIRTTRRPWQLSQSPTTFCPKLRLCQTRLYFRCDAIDKYRC